MDSFGVGKSTLKTAGAAIGEKLGRLKPNEQLSGYSPLSRVLELEMLRSGVEGKHALWNSLVEVAETTHAAPRRSSSSSKASSRAPSSSSRACASITAWRPSRPLRRQLLRSPRTATTRQGGSSMRAGSDPTRA